ncbi:MAG: hypothetical protein WBC92_15345, partial [Terracidiphilus sp.]
MSDETLQQLQPSIKPAPDLAFEAAATATQDQSLDAGSVRTDESNSVQVDEPVNEPAPKPIEEPAEKPAPKPIEEPDKEPPLQEPDKDQGPDSGSSFADMLSAFEHEHSHRSETRQLRGTVVSLTA